jgi:heat shock protein HslJ
MRHGMSRLITALSILVATGVLQPAAGGGIDLVGTAWLVDDIGGRGVIDRARTTLQFLEPGQVAGHTGCNRFFGPVEVNGESIAFGNLATTRMACPEALMTQEQRFLGAMAKARRIALGEHGQVLLVYDDDGEPALRLSRIVEK